VPFIEDEKETKDDPHDENHEDAGQHSDDAAHDAGSSSSSDGYTLEEGLEYYMDPGHLFGHVQDSHHFEVPKFLSSSGKLSIPNLTGYTKENPMIPGINFVGRPTKFMALELLAAIVITVAYVWLARKVTHEGKAPKGWLWNFLESIVCFIRNDIAIPSIGKQDADRFLPFLLTMFFFIIVLNLFGMIPFMGGATGALGVTAVLAVITFVIVMGVGMKKMGVVGFIKAQVPTMDLSPALAFFLIPAIWAIEVFRRSPGVGGVPRVYRGGGGQLDDLSDWALGSRGCGCPEPVGAVCRLFAGICFHFFGGPVYRGGLASSLA
jgi:F-type H+-transporting ATPase subunit a